MRVAALKTSAAVARAAWRWATLPRIAAQRIASIIDCGALSAPKQRLMPAS